MPLPISKACRRSPSRCRPFATRTQLLRRGDPPCVVAESARRRSLRGVPAPPLRSAASAPLAELRDLADRAVQRPALLWSRSPMISSTCPAECGAVVANGPMHRERHQRSAARPVGASAHRYGTTVVMSPPVSAPSIAAKVAYWLTSSEATTAWPPRASVTASGAWAYAASKNPCVRLVQGHVPGGQLVPERVELVRHTGHLLAHEAMSKVRGTPNATQTDFASRPRPPVRRKWSAVYADVRFPTARRRAV